MPVKLTSAKSMEKVFENSGSGSTGVSMWWLGQAGFAISVSGIHLLIDPYLSDFLAIKYASQEFPHQRMMAAPVAPDQLRDIHYVVCSHRHSDHMDPGTLPVIHENNSECRFIIPNAWITHALSLGIPFSCLLPIHAWEIIELAKDLTIKGLPSAHETLQVDAEGNHLFLGYILSTPRLRLYHSGDCVPYEGLNGILRGENIDVALLPVNGRDEYRSNRGILGNFTIQEAVDLCQSAGIHTLYPHHYGMFNFNTVSHEILEEWVVRTRNQMQFIIPEIGVRYSIDKST
jgi:L-ascorbate metabolism protein UlaG (beta-lactamase superfamily)